MFLKGGGPLITTRQRKYTTNHRMRQRSFNHWIPSPLLVLRNDVQRCGLKSRPCCKKPNLRALPKCIPSNMERYPGRQRSGLCPARFAAAVLVGTMNSNH